jgi:thiol-disulfide isomerase/thioredoxin
MKFKILALIAVIALLSCNKTIEDSSKVKSKIQGKIATISGKTIYVCLDDPYDFGFTVIPIDSAKIDAAGNFEIEFKCPAPRAVMLKVGEEVILWNLFVLPNDDLKIDVHNENVADVVITYEGKSAKANKFLKEYNSKYPKGDLYNETLLKSNVKDWISYTDKRKEDGLKYIDYYFNPDTIPDFIRKRLESYMNYQHAISRIDFALNYYYTPDKQKTINIDTTYWAFLKTMKLEDNDLPAFMGRYLEALTAEWQSKQLSEGRNPDGLERARAKYEIAKKRFWGKSLDVAVSYSIYDILTSSSQPVFLDMAKTLIDDYNKFSRDKDYVDYLVKLHKKRSDIQPGKPAPDFSLVDMKNETVNLTKFKGKVIYINFWGSWCAPCLDELPAYKELAEKYKTNNNVVFISVALEYRNFDTWRDYLRGQQISGVHLYAERQFDNEVCKKYLITGVPTCVLIDSQGKIVSTDAPRPVDKNVADEINTLLKAI